MPVIVYFISAKSRVVAYSFRLMLNEIASTSLEIKRRCLHDKLNLFDVLDDLEVEIMVLTIEPNWNTR